MREGKLRIFEKALKIGRKIEAFISAIVEAEDMNSGTRGVAARMYKNSRDCEEADEALHMIRTEIPKFLAKYGKYLSVRDRKYLQETYNNYKRTTT